MTCDSPGAAPTVSLSQGWWAACHPLVAVGGHRPAKVDQQEGGTQSCAHPSSIPPRSSGMESHCCYLLDTAIPNPSQTLWGGVCVLELVVTGTLAATAISPNLG